MQSVLVQSVIDTAIDIRAFELVHPDGRPLARFTAGAHIDVKGPSGVVRQYSLCNDPAESHRYVIAVLRVRDGRGGSAAMHAEVRVGDRLEVSSPRNNFPLQEDAKGCLLIAGGIGITPLMAMVHELARRHVPFSMHYCTRSPLQTAFLAELRPLVESGIVQCHHDGGDASKGLELGALLKIQKPGTHLYCCGPVGMMKAVAAASAHWAPGSVHFEHFSREMSSSEPTEYPGRDFLVKLARSGATFAVPKGKSILQVLRENGLKCDSSCEAGLCGTCRTRYFEGTPDHHDLVLTSSEQAEYLMLCCARAKSSYIVLDL